MYICLLFLLLLRYLFIVCLSFKSLYFKSWRVVSVYIIVIFVILLSNHWLLNWYNSQFIWSAKCLKFFKVFFLFAWIWLKKRSQYVGFDARSKVQKYVIDDWLFMSWEIIHIGCLIWCWFAIAFDDSMLQDVHAFCVNEEVHVQSSNFECEDLF